MSEYRLFFSWQNDRKDTKTLIHTALEKVKSKLKTKGIDLFLDQDTRERVGKRNIDAEVLDKIRKCDIFVADLTPVTTYISPKDSHDLPKHMPNSNVMYEYGYALHAKGENRMIVLASLEKEKDEHIEYMPFDINHDTITLFSDEKSLNELYNWISKIIEDVDKEREAKAPQYACELLFRKEEGLGYTDEITIKPRYKRIWYKSQTPKYDKVTDASEPSLADVVTNPLKLHQAQIDRLNVVPATHVKAKVVRKTTNLSYVPIHLVFLNRGSDALDNLEISIYPSDERVTFANRNVEEKWGFSIIKKVSDTNAGEYGIFQDYPTVNPNGCILFDEVFVHAPHDIGSFSLSWTLRSRTFADNGVLIVHVDPDYEYDSYENDELAGTEKVIDLEVSE